MTYLSQGRVQQKLRTRNALIETAAQLLRDKRTFTTEEVADLAGVGRTTAYRYFPTLDELLAGAANWVLLNEARARYVPTMQATASKSYQERLQGLLDANEVSVADHEQEFRTVLRLSLEPPQDEDAGKRQALRPGIFREFLAGIEEDIPEERLTVLVQALSLFVGVESWIILSDVCGLSRRQAHKVRSWGAQVLLKAALSETKFGETKIGETKSAKPKSTRIGNVKKGDGRRAAKRLNGKKP